ncbi:MAG: CPBP family intramembrane metalloprotease [Planctomycetes bacterium]|nr:CPBP family intramembrane metalloprotease [Planctomycetota bacterium]
MAPMLAAYELALFELPSPPRNACEFLLTLPIELFGTTWLRWSVLGVCVLAALYVTRRRGASARWGVARIALEGSIFAVLLGPLLVALGALLERWLPSAHLTWTMPTDAPPLLPALLLWGGGAWEELFFRVGGYSIGYLLSLRTLTAFGVSEGLARAAAEVFALLGSSLCFAAFHLEACTGWIGAGGEAFDAGIFTWRALAGILLGLVFRLRGPGVAAWTHGLFNLALLVGAGPEVIL